MVFSSSIFIFIFLPILFCLYYIANNKCRNVILLIASLLFYSWGEPKYIFLMLFSIVINYALGFLVEKEWKLKKLFLVMAVVVNLGLLFYFKYTNFALDTFSRIARVNVTLKDIALPIGISFYTFQIMSYVIDVYRGNVKAQRNIVKLALYIALFPQLIAGPIVRYVDIEKQINNRIVNVSGVYNGIIRFMIGFSKKVLIADQLSSFVGVAFEGSRNSILIKWVGIIAYTLQIYYDFSGYSDMAIGLGKMLGFDFLENFSFPYISETIQEFWRRWHISLGSWFRDYLYIPLGGNRKGKVRTYINLIIVFMLTGFWHGASFNFIAWGLYYAFFLVIERLGFSKVLNKLPKAFRHIYSVIVVMFGWILFRAEGLKNALIYIKDMFVLHGDDFRNFAIEISPSIIFWIVVGIIFAIPYPWIKTKIEEKNALKIVRDVVLMVVFLIAISFMVGSGYSPFLYFRF
ncbi:MAG: MBOAT family protein [Lachnospiraceae bacterium]|nr:MBOAT family protein [Lachnospiraceae bacterium]